MPTFEDSAVGTNEAQTSLWPVALATRSIDTPRQIYSVLGSLISANASLNQSLHQLGAVPDSSSTRSIWVVTDSRIGSAAAYKGSWQQHRFAEILHQGSVPIRHADGVESTAIYDHHDFCELADAPRRTSDRGMRL
jgi:hypothetical protein